MQRHIFSETADIEFKNKSICKFDNKPVYIPNANLSGKSAIIVNNKLKVLHTHCRKCKTKLESKIWQYLGICAMCDMQ